MCRKFDEAVKALPKGAKTGATVTHDRAGIAGLAAGEALRGAFEAGEAAFGRVPGVSRRPDRRAEVKARSGVRLSGEPVDAVDGLPAGWTPRNQQQPCRTEYQAVCDGAQELPV